MVTMHYVAKFVSIKSKFQGSRVSIANGRWEAQWSPPSEGRFKMYMDAAINSEAQTWGLVLSSTTTVVRSKRLYP